MKKLLKPEGVTEYLGLAVQISYECKPDSYIVHIEAGESLRFRPSQEETQ